jgi:hypothetical protein
MKIKSNHAVVLLGALLLAPVIRACAADTPPAPTVAVYDFTGDADATGYNSKVTALVTANLTDATNLVMIERAQLDKALNEQAFGVSGLVSSDAAAKIGRLTGAQILVAGQIIKSGDNHLIIVADIIGTETGRLYASKVEGASDNLLPLTSELSRNIADIICAQTTNLLAPVVESHTSRIARMIQDLKGTNRPSISVNIEFFGGNNHWRDDWAEYEFGAVLLQAGFTVVDNNSDRKADIEIIGNASGDDGPGRAGLFSSTGSIDIKIQERRTGAILGFDHQTSTATGPGAAAASRSAHVNAVDAIMARILPLLAK